MAPPEIHHYQRHPSQAPRGTEFDWRKSKQLLGTPSNANVLGLTTNLKMSLKSNFWPLLSDSLRMFTAVFTQHRKLSGWVGPRLSFLRDYQ